MTLFKNVTAVYPYAVKRDASVMTEDGVIYDADFTGEAPAGTEVIDCGGAYLMAGFIDIHVHGGGGADFMDGTAEAFGTATRAHLCHGTTAMTPTALTATEDELAGFINAYHEYRRKEHDGAKTVGLHLEGPYFSGVGSKSKGAQKGDLLRPVDEAEMHRLLNIADGDIVRWDAAPELENSDVFAKTCRENGILAAVAHTSATSEQTEKGFEYGFRHVTHFYNAVTTYGKVGQKVLAGVVEATYLNSDVSVELICDGKHIPKDVLRLALKIKGPRAVSAITDAMRIAGTDMAEGNLGSLREGSRVIVDDGVAKLPDLSSFAGSICTMDRALRVLHLQYGISLPDASSMLSFAPAKTLGLERKMGSIENGKTADFVLLDDDFTVISVFLDGKEKYHR